MELRPYQLEVLSRMRESLSRPGGKIVAIATGTGKTTIFAKFLADMGLPSLVLAHKQELLHQAAARIIQAGIPASAVDVVCQSEPCRQALIHVASIQTLKNRVLAVAPQIIVVDECHHATASTYQTILGRYPGAHLFGFTATPLRASRRETNKLAEMFPETIYSYSLEQAIEDGWLCPIRYKSVTTNVDLTACAVTGGDFSRVDLARLLDTADRNRLVVETYRELAPGKSVVFCPTVNHAHSLAQAFNTAGIEAYAVDGHTPPAERATILQRLHSAGVETSLVVCNCDVLTEGVDIPDLAAVFLSPTLSEIIYSQRIGRVTRLHPSKTHGLVVDFHDLHRKKKLVNILRFLPKLEVVMPLPTNSKPRKLSKRELARQVRLKNRALRDIDIFAPTLDRRTWQAKLPATEAQIQLLLKISSYLLEELLELKKVEASALIAKLLKELKESKKLF